MLLDTSFFIDLSREAKTRRFGPCAGFLLAHRSETKRVSVVTLGEYSVGASTRDTVRFFRGYQRIALGVDTALYAGRLQTGLKFTLGENDLWIAATALRFGWPLVTRDGAFSLVPGLHVLKY